MCSETSEAVGTTWEHAQLEFQNFLKIRIPLPEELRVQFWLSWIVFWILGGRGRGGEGGQIQNYANFQLPVEFPPWPRHRWWWASWKLPVPQPSNHPSPTIQPSPPSSSSQTPQTPSLESLHHQFDRFPMPPNFTHFHSCLIQTHY